MMEKEAIIAKNLLLNKTCDNCFNKIFLKSYSEFIDDGYKHEGKEFCYFTFSAIFPKERTCENWNSKKHN